MKKNKLKNLIKKILKEDPSPETGYLDTKIPSSPNYRRPDGAAGALPTLDMDKDKGDYPGAVVVNMGVWKIISVTPNYSGNTPQQKYSGLCPGGTNTGTSSVLNPNKNKAKSIQRNKRPQKR